MSARAAIGPDRATLDAFVGSLFRHADDGTFLALRAFNDDRTDERPIFINSARIGDAKLSDWVFNLARTAATHELRANFCPPVCTFTQERKADEAAIANGVALTVECDENPAASKRQLVDLIGEPTVTAASGGEWVNPTTGEIEPKLHLHWRLTEPTRDPDSHKRLKEARRLACAIVGADATAVPLNHPLRWPGSVHRKGVPKLARIVEQTEHEVELAEVLDKLRAACPEAGPEATARPGSSFGFPPDLTGDLLDITAALSVIPNDNLDWNEWVKIGLATWTASRGGAFAAFDAWSRKSAKYDPQTTADRWDHFGRHPADRIGAGTLYFHAQNARPGWRKPSSYDRRNDQDPRPRLENPQPNRDGEEQPKSDGKSSRSAKAPKRDANELRPVIRLVAGELARTVDQAEDALISTECGVFQRGSLIVGVGSAPMVTAHRKTIVLPQIFEMGEHRLLELMMSAAVFEKWDGRAKNFVPCSAPVMIPKTLKERRGKLRLPPLSGLINAPTIRSDGTLLDEPGYDAATGLLYDPADTVFPEIPAQPTKRQAFDALEVIEELIAGFPFIAEADRSVALAAILTATVRKSLPTAPAFAFSAPVAGTGKSTLVDIMSVISTGREAGVIAMGGNPEETEKRVASLLLSGNAVAIDNAEAGFGGELMCQILSQSTVRMRVLGRSETPEMQTNVMVTATGNNLTVDGDMARRTLLCRLDPKVERPELREFAFDPIAKAKEGRGHLLVAALTVLRAYCVAGQPPQVTRLGSFGDWSDLIRSALMWLGRADPVDTIEQSRTYDPQLERLKAVLVQWRKVIGSESVTANEAASRASTKSVAVYEAGRTAFVHPEFREALIAVAGANGFIEPGKLGAWLGRNKSRVIEGMRIVPAPMLDGIKKWQVIFETKQTSAPTPDEYAKERWP